MEKDLLLNLIEESYPQLVDDKGLIMNIFEESEEDGFTPEENILQYANNEFINVVDNIDMVDIINKYYEKEGYNSHIFLNIYRYFDYISKYFIENKRTHWVDIYNVLSKAYEMGVNNTTEDDWIYMDNPFDEPEEFDSTDIESEFFTSISSSIEYFDMAYKLYQKYGSNDEVIELWSNHFDDIVTLWEEYNYLDSLDDE